MDIDYLLALQDFRNNTGNALTPFMEGISLFAVTYLVMLPVLIYWLLDRKSGLYVLASYYTCCAVNASVKLTACVYRPWIRDARVLPAGDAIETATGYSFPSGHTVTAGPIYGGLAVISWKKWKWLSAIFVLCAVITAFSRNYLGVHTPQDVFVGIFESVLWLVLIRKLFGYLAGHPDKLKWFLLGGFLFGWAAIAYITFKPYPMTYVDGKLLVDPQRMMNDGYGDTAYLIGLCVALFVERKWIRFEAAGLNAKGIGVCAVGMVGLWAMLTYLKSPLDALLGTHWGHFLHSFLVVFYCIALVPLFIKLICGTHSESEAKA